MKQTCKLFNRNTTQHNFNSTSTHQLPHLMTGYDSSGSGNVRPLNYTMSCTKIREQALYSTSNKVLTSTSKNVK